MPFVSILIPVYNGATYIQSAIQSVLNQIDGDFEVVVGIDESSDSSELLVREFDDSRLRVFSHHRRLGMTENYTFLISQARGEWVTILGQDDALVPFAISMLRKITACFPQHELLTSRRSYVFWPDTLKSYSKYSFIFPIDTRKPRLVSSRKFLKKAISGYREYSEGPQLYTGTFAKRRLIDRITSINQGKFYNYLIPDVCSATNFLTNTCEFIFLPLPLFIVGSSSNSTGTAIDHVIAQSTEPSSNSSINSFFSSSATDSWVPGSGVFSSFAWYMYEAYTEGLKFQTDSENPTSLRNVPRLALAALKFESRKSKTFSPLQQRHFQQLSKEIPMCKVESGLRQFMIHTIVLQRKLARYISALVLFVSQRLVLSIANNNEEFSLSRYCVMVTSNKHLRNYLGDSQKKDAHVETR